MSFSASPTNMTELLVACLAVVSIVMLLKKRYDSNLPLLFYFLAVLFTNGAGREVHPAILYGGLAFCLLLRFEFMGNKISKVVAFFANVGLVTIIWLMMTDILTLSCPAIPPVKAFRPAAPPRSKPASRRRAKW